MASSGSWPDVGAFTVLIYKSVVCFSGFHVRVSPAMFFSVHISYWRWAGPNSSCHHSNRAKKISLTFEVEFKI